MKLILFLFISITALFSNDIEDMMNKEYPEFVSKIDTIYLNESRNKADVYVVLINKKTYKVYSEERTKENFKNIRCYPEIFTNMDNSKYLASYTGSVTKSARGRFTKCKNLNPSPIMNAYIKKTLNKEKLNQIIKEN